MSKLRGYFGVGLQFVVDYFTLLMLVAGSVVLNYGVYMYSDKLFFITSGITIIILSIIVDAVREEAVREAELKRVVVKNRGIGK